MTSVYVEAPTSERDLRRTEDIKYQTSPAFNIVHPMDSFDNEVLIESARFDFTTHGNHWLELFSENLAQADIDIRLDFIERSSSQEGITIRLSLNGRSLAETGVRILVRDTSAEFRLFHPGTEREEILSVITQAVSSATQHAGRSTKNFKWSAMIAQAPHAKHHPTRLVSTLHVEDLTIEPGNTVFAEVVHPGRTFDSSYRIHLSQPLRVRGQTPASSWELASLKADHTMRRLCGLLALIWEIPYKVATSVVDCRYGDASSRSTRAGIQLADDSADGSVSWEEHLIPEHADKAWRKLNSSVALQNAVDAYLEARYVQEQHQALALVAYISSIEAIANLLFERPKDSGITKAFRAALRVVLSEAEAEKLDRVYSWRSTTVHQGRMHGAGASSAPLLTDIFATDVFSNLASLLPQLRRAARTLLVRALLEQLPSKRKLDDG